MWGREGCMNVQKTLRKNSRILVVNEESFNELID